MKVTTIRENNDGDKCGTFARLVGRLLDVAELFYRLLSEDTRRKQQYAEEEHMNSEQRMYMEQDFDWDFQQGRR